MARRRTEEDHAARSASTRSSVRPVWTVVNCRYIRVDSGTGLVADWLVTCSTSLETETNASVHVCKSVGVMKGEVKAKYGAFHRKGYDHSSVAGGGALALSARPCRNVDEAE